MTRYYIHDREVGDFLRPGTAILWFDNEADANAHLRRLPQESVAARRYQVVRVEHV
jgi:hypothetical protein